MLASAQFIEQWSYERLTSEADVILIVRPTAIKKTNVSEAVPRTSIGYMVDGVRKSKPVFAKVNLATCEILAQLKGEVKSKQITLRYLRVPEGELKGLLAAAFYSSGPIFVTFDTKKKPRYLVFLKKLKNGQYRSISDQLDPYHGIVKIPKPAGVIEE